MAAMKRIVLIVAVALAAVRAAGQVPAGFSYNPNTHPNPFVTWVRSQDFKTAAFSDAKMAADIEIMSLSQSEATRESIELAIPIPARQRVRIANLEAEVTFYPVVRQNYKLKAGGSFVMYSFRFPRAPVTAGDLNEAAFGRPRRQGEGRFGSENLPERLEVRGEPGLMFDNGKKRVLYWFELGAGQVVESDVSREELFRVLDDLL